MLCRLFSLLYCLVLWFGDSVDLLCGCLALDAIALFAWGGCMVVTLIGCFLLICVALIVCGLLIALVAGILCCVVWVWDGLVVIVVVVEFGMGRWVVVVC